jgi:diguanylate cyclase (GGDEF)-like protein
MHRIPKAVITFLFTIYFIFPVKKLVIYLMAQNSDKRLFDRSSSAAHTKWLKESFLTKLRDVVDGKIEPGKFATDLAVQIDKLEQDRIRDPLTGAFNRGFIGAVLGQEIALAHKTKRDLGLILLDIDHFKSINDQEPDGHVAGDRTLVEIKRLLTEICGTHSLVGRWGGEEFVLITPNITIETLTEMATEIGQTIAGWLAKNARLVRPQVTASMGAVIVRDMEPAVDLIARADKLLYEAKESGRARLILDSNPQVVIKFVE